MKKLLSILLAIAVFTSCATCAFAESTSAKTLKSGEYTYTLIGSKAQILSYNGKSKKVTVPSTIDGRTVVKIGSDVDLITIIDDSYDDFDEDGYYEDDGEGAFEKTKVESVTIPDTVTELGVDCFSGCKYLKKVRLSKNLKYLSASAFRGCKSLKTVKIPDSVTEICSMAFSGTAIGKINIPKNVKIINLNSFGNKLKKLTVSNKNKYFSAKDGVLYNKKKTKLIIYPTSKTAKSFKTPKTVKELGVYSFNGIKNLEKLTISKGVKRIDGNAFVSCKKLKKLVIQPRGNKKLVFESHASEFCNKLKSVTLPRAAVIGSKALGYYYIDTGYSEYDYSQKVKGFTIKGYRKSSAEKYAEKNGIKFTAIN